MQNEKRCERCGKETLMTIMSMFNTQTICMECKEEETNRPDYDVACQVETDEVKRGNLNFPGIGLRSIAFVRSQDKT